MVLISSRPVIPKLGGAHRSGAQNIESGARKNDGNAAKLNYQLMKLSVYKLTFQKAVQLAVIMQSDVLRSGTLVI
jgi:hypothetical protein